MNDMENKSLLPVCCPSCGSRLQVRRLGCPSCGTEVMGDYPLPALMRLSVEEQEFVLAFVRSSGSLKEMASLLKLSYPTVRNKLDDIIEKLGKQD